MGEGWYEFSFKGYYRGKKITRICLYDNNHKPIMGKDYISYLNVKKIQQTTLVVSLVKLKEFCY